MFDTSASHKKTKTRRIIVFTKFLVFSYMFYYCMELLYMMIVEKKGPFSRCIFVRYLPHVNVFVLVYLKMVSHQKM